MREDKTEAAIPTVTCSVRYDVTVTQLQKPQQQPAMQQSMLTAGWLSQALEDAMHDRVWCNPTE